MEHGDDKTRKKIILEFDTSLGKALTHIREDQDLTQDDIADSLGCKQPLISKIEAGQRSLKFAEVGLFATALGISRDELVVALLYAMDHPSAHEH